MRRPDPPAASVYDAPSGRSVPLDRYEAVALAMALGGTFEPVETQWIPQMIFDTLYETRLLELRTDISGEGYPHVTDAGRARLVELLGGLPDAD